MHSPLVDRRQLLALLPALGLNLSAQAAPTELRWLDPVRQRTLPLRLRLPPGNSTVPLVLFSHGLGGSLDGGTRWAEAWAQAGIATLNLQHSGSDAEQLHSEGLRGLRTAASGEQLQARCADVVFVLDELARRQAAGDAALARLRLDAIGLAGHSFGAHTCLAVAGQGFGRAGGASLLDPRPRAFAAFSPAPPNARVSTPEAAFAAIRRPVLCLTGSLDSDPLNRDDSTRQAGGWRRAVYDALPPGDKAELWLDGADHFSFGGLAGNGRARHQSLRPAAARDQTERHAKHIAEVSSLWWRAQLLGDGAARAALQTRPDGLQTLDEWRRA